MKRVSVSIVLLMLLSISALGQNYHLPAGARIIETQPLNEKGYSRRLLILWMVNPEKRPRDPLDGAYSCPEETRGSFFRGPVRVSLFNLDQGRIINTIKIRQAYYGRADTFDLPFNIHAGSHYLVPDVPEGSEGRPKLIWLRDYNGDGKDLEFALFDAQACMGLATTLIGYSERQDRVIQYQIRLRLKGRKKQLSIGHWGDYLFSLKPCTTGYWNYEIDYRGRGGSLNKYTIRYNAEAERFEGEYEWTAKADTFVPYYTEPRRCINGQR